MMRRTLGALACVALSATPATLSASNAAATHVADRLPAGDGSFQFTHWNGPALTVFTHLPPKVTASTPIVLVIHGYGRNAKGYRKAWAKLADANDFIVAVPYFDDQRFPDSRSYNQGGITNKDGTARPRDRWAFAAIEPLFDAMRARTGSRVASYALYGHSAGAQFVHRFVFLTAHPHLSLAISANAGSYAMPVFDIDYPYGLRGAPVDKAQLEHALATRMIVLLGTADTDPQQKDLPREPQAMAQGPYRLARGEAFFAAAQRLHTPLAWQLRFAPGAGHSNGAMAPFAAPFLGEGFVGKQAVAVLPSN